MKAVKDRLRDTLRPDSADDVWIGPSPDPRGARATARRRRRGPRPAVRVVDGGDGRAVPHRRAAADRLPGPGRDRHQREPARSGHRVRATITTRRGGWTGSRARGATSRAGWGWCRSCCATSRGRPGRRSRPASRCRRILPGEGVELESGERIRAAQRGVQRRSAPDPRPARRRRRSGVGGAGALDPDRRRHGQGEHDPHRAARLHRPARHAGAAPHRPGQHAAVEAGVAGLPPARQRRASCRPARGTSSTSRRCTTRASRPRASTRSACSRSTCPTGFARAPGTAGGTRSGGRWSDRSAASAATCRGRSPRSRCWGRRTSSGAWASPGGHIFQGEILPQYMWDRRLGARTPMRGCVPVRGRHPSRGQRHRHQRAERGDGGVGRGGLRREVEAGRRAGGQARGDGVRRGVKRCHPERSEGSTPRVSNPG